MRNTPKAGEHYRHFKGNEYVIDSIAIDTETDETQVVYHDSADAAKIFVRSLEMFLSPVDKEKYPSATQENRFEKIENVVNYQVDERLTAFLDARDYKEKLDILATMKENITEKLVEDMAVCLDFKLNEGSLEDKFESIRKCLLTLQSFEGTRLR